MNDLLPAEVETKLMEFLRAGKTGNLQVDIVNGSIQKAKLTESIEMARGGRVER